MTAIEIFTEQVPLPMVSPPEYYQALKRDKDVVRTLIHPWVPELRGTMKDLVLRCLAEGTLFV
jgi:hypothetical protein